MQGREHASVWARHRILPLDKLEAYFPREDLEGGRLTRPGRSSKREDAL